MDDDWEHDWENHLWYVFFQHILDKNNTRNLQDFLHSKGIPDSPPAPWVFFLKRARKNAIVLWFLLFLSLFLQSNRWFLIGIISFLPQMSLSDMSMFVATTSKCFTTILTYVWSPASMGINVILKIWFGFENFPTIFTFVAFWVFWFDNSFYNNLVNSPKMRSQFICNITSFTIWNYNK